METTFYMWLTFIVFWVDKAKAIEDYNFPQNHLNYHGIQPAGEGVCEPDKSCDKVPTEETYRDVKRKYCWGYEDDCSPSERFSHPECYEHHLTWASNLEDQKNLFWDQGDFGYVKKKKVTLTTLCHSKNEGDSFLECTKNMQFCRAEHIYFNFRNFRESPINDRHMEDLFQPGDVGGHCELDSQLLSQQGGAKWGLQSWFSELEHYTQLPFKPSNSHHCEVTVTKPTILIKLDTGMNMYHHFCDFVNLYASQHVNGNFSRDVQIVMWDTSNMSYPDPFSETWKVFSKYPIKRLQEYKGLKVCFANAMFPLLARMVHGLYYNMPLVSGCWKSGLFQAFSQHSLHRLGIHPDNFKDDQIRITFLVRNTQYRKILNQDELIGAMKRIPRFNVTAIDYNWKISFLDQLKITHNTDILVGMHGAGLTHMLFLPDWAVVFELYNAGDYVCYRNLASLRGVKYMTWIRKETLFQEHEGHHPTPQIRGKYTNYAFQVDEFMRLIVESADYVMEARNSSDYKYTDSPGF